MQASRVIVADDQVLVRAGIVAILEDMGGFECIVAVADGRHCMIACAENTPDILLLDIHMPDMNGLDVARTIRKTYPSVRIVILTSSTDAELARKAISMGAYGFVSKDFVLDELALAMRSVSEGRVYMSLGRHARQQRTQSTILDTQAARGAALHRSGPVQQGNRPRAGRERQDGGVPPRRADPAPGSARCGQPDALCRCARHGRLITPGRSHRQDARHLLEGIDRLARAGPLANVRRVGRVANVFFLGLAATT
jgi:DNA-binding NarL/FixJ family response regulator